MKSRRRPAFTVVVLFLLVLACAFDPPRAACAAVSEAGPSPSALEAGLAARAQHREQVPNSKRWTLIDYSLPFTSVRLWVLDAEHGHSVVLASRVSHAWRSGLLYATTFSNQYGSELSSLGSFVTTTRPYDGGYGHSLRVRGLDPGQNDAALRRAIIFHPDLGMTHSAGCFMLPEDQAAQIVDTIAGGTFVYVYGPQAQQP
jgi:hypothetical protein